MKELEQQNVSTEEATKLIKEQRDKILSDFSIAYLAGTNLAPDQIELVHENKTENGLVTDIFYFRRKEDEKG